jgi:predicted ribosomally synthesized peptide with SipW-like signal peptide
MFNKILGFALVLGLVGVLVVSGGFALFLGAARSRLTPRRGPVRRGRQAAGANLREHNTHSMSSQSSPIAPWTAEHPHEPTAKRLRGDTLGSAMLNRILVAAAVIGVIGAFFGSGGLAIFTDTQSVPANTFVTGTVDISSSPTTALVTLSAMAPGGQVTAPITVTNAGTLALRYAVTSTTTENVLAAALDLTIKSGVSTCDTANFAADGTVLYGPADLGSTTGVNVIGDPTTGADTGDRALSASANEILCFNVKLPLAAGNSSQGVTTTATFAFAAEQTANN